MSLEDLIGFLVEAHRDPAHSLTALTIRQCMLRAYAMGMEHGDLSPTRCLACGCPVPPRVQEKMYCSVNCKARLGMRRMRQRRTVTSLRGVEDTP